MRAVVIPATHHCRCKIGFARSTVTHRTSRHHQFVWAMGLIEERFRRHVFAGSTRALTPAQRAKGKLLDKLLGGAFLKFGLAHLASPFMISYNNTIEAFIVFCHVAQMKLGFEE